MNELVSNARKSGLYRLWSSFSPGTRAALVLLLPYTMVDAVHYYTAGTALVFSLPIILLIYLYCGVIAGRFAKKAGYEEERITQQGLMAGVTLWLISTIINALIAIFVGAASLGLTLVLGVPYLLLCGPVFLIASGLGGWLGANLHLVIIRRTELDIDMN